MLRRRHHHLGTEALRGIADARIVGGDHHAARTARPGPLPDALNQRLSINQQQRLTRQARRGESSGNDDVEHEEQPPLILEQADHREASARASSGTIMGIPSRTA